MIPHINVWCTCILNYVCNSKPTVWKSVPWIWKGWGASNKSDQRRGIDFVWGVTEQTNFSVWKKRLPTGYMLAIWKLPTEAFTVFSKNETLHNETTFLNHRFNAQEVLLYALHSEAAELYAAGCRGYQKPTGLQKDILQIKGRKTHWGPLSRETQSLVQKCPKDKLSGDNPELLGIVTTWLPYSYTPLCQCWKEGNRLTWTFGLCQQRGVNILINDLNIFQKPVKNHADPVGSVF